MAVRFVCGVFQAVLLPIMAFAGPSGEQVVFGTASVDRSSPHLLEVRQGSERAVVEWDDFSLSAGETMRFVQPGPDSAILNRVVGGNLTEIYGRLEGNGQIFLVNPQGVLVGESGRIDCGAFMAAAFDVDNLSFASGDALAFKGDGGSVVNLGKIAAHGGKVYLVGSGVDNSGSAEGSQGVVIQIGDLSGLFVRTNVSELAGDLDNAYALAMNRDGCKDATYVHRLGARVFLDDEASSARNFQYVDVTGTLFPNGGLYVEDTLNALQQLGSVIPERLWYQRFDILVNQARFRAAGLPHSKCSLLMGSEPLMGIGSSGYYFLQNTVSGDPIRICDDYMEFLDSPYWKTPEGMEQLANLQTKELK